MYNIIIKLKYKMNKQKYTQETVKMIKDRTNLSSGEILIKLITYEMTPTEIIEEDRILEYANWNDTEVAL